MFYLFAFNEFDSAGDGYISIGDLCRAFQALNEYEGAENGVTSQRERLQDFVAQFHAGASTSKVKPETVNEVKRMVIELYENVGSKAFDGNYRVEDLEFEFAGIVNGLDGEVDRLLHKDGLEVDSHSATWLRNISIVS